MSVIPTSRDAAGRALPASKASHSSEGASPYNADGATSALKGARILLAEDDAVMREYARLLLVEHGAVVSTVADGSEALARIRSEPPDLALLDVLMPHVSGLELLDHIRADGQLRTLPVIMLSGQTSEDAKLAGFRAGADDYLTKPYSERELLARVGGQLAMARIRNDQVRHERALRAEADLLNEVALELTSELELRALVQKVTDTGTRLTNAALGAFFYASDEADGLELFTVSGVPREQFDRVGLTRAAELLGPTLREKSVVRMDDVARDGRYGSVPPYVGTPDGRLVVRSYLAVPVLSHCGDTVGALLFGHPEAGRFDERAERFARGIAAQAAVAIDNAQLYDRARSELAERVRAEEALRATQRRYAQLVEALPVAVYTCDAEGRVHLFNDAAVALWGVRPDRGKRWWWELFRLRHSSGEPLAPDETPLAAVLRDEPLDELEEFVVESPEGGRRNVIPHSVPIRDGEGTLQGTVNLLMDITDRKKGEQSRALLAAIVESSTDAIVSIDLENRITFWNAGAETLYGYSAGEAMSRDISIIVPTDQRAEQRAVVARIRNGEPRGTIETIRVTRDGRPVDVSLTISPIRDKDGQVIGISKIARDITARNAMKQALERSEQQLRLVIDALPAMVSYIDRDLRYRFFNRQLKSWFGLEPSAIEERTMLEVMGKPAFEVLRPHIETVLAGEQTRFETEVRDRNGAMRTVEVTYVPDRRPDGRVEGFIGLLNDITERVHSEREIARLNADLRARVQELETLQELIPVGVFIAHDPECTLITANRAGIDIVEADDSTMNLSKSGPDADALLLDVYQNGTKVDPADQPMQRAARGQEVIAEVYEFVFHDGRVKHVQISASPLKDASGKVRGSIGTIVDISTTMRAERAIRESEHRFRSVAMNAPAAIYIKDPEGVYRMANPLTCSIFGRRDVAGFTDYDLIDAETADKRRESDLKVLTSGEPLETEEAIRINGIDHEFLSAKFPLVGGDGRITGVCGVSVDITARKRAENALRQTMARTQLLADVSEQLLAASDPLSVVDQLCRKVASFAHCDLYAVRLLEESTGVLSLRSFDGISDRHLAGFEQIEIGAMISGEVARTGEARIVTHVDETDAPELAEARRLGLRAYACHPLQVAGRITGTLSFATRVRPAFSEDDVELMRTVANQVSIAMERLTSRQALLDVNAMLEEHVRERTMKLIQQRQQLQRLAAELTTAEQRERKRLASLLHDGLQQLLVGAKMLMGTLERRRDDPEDLLETCKRVEKLIDDSIHSARDMSRQLRPPVLYEDGLVPALCWLASEMERLYGIEVSVTEEDNVEPADDDQRAFLFECVRELLLNAVKHAGVDEASIEARRTDDGLLQLVVRDAGRGFDAGFESPERPNEGFGLFSIRERLASLGGQFSIDSQSGRGTVAIIEAPILDAPSDPDEPLLLDQSFDAPPEPASAHGTRVLVVDDHALVREGIATMIDEDQDFCVVAQAADGVEAIEAVERVGPDIVLMDLNMPRMNGIEATRLIRRQRADIIIVGLSVQEDETTANSVMDAGASAFLSKSSTPDAIMKTMRSLVSERRSRA